MLLAGLGQAVVLAGWPVALCLLLEHHDEVAVAEAGEERVQRANACDEVAFDELGGELPAIHGLGSEQAEHAVFDDTPAELGGDVIYHASQVTMRRKIVQCLRVLLDSSWRTKDCDEGERKHEQVSQVSEREYADH